MSPLFNFSPPPSWPISCGGLVHLSASSATVLSEFTISLLLSFSLTTNLGMSVAYRKSACSVGGNIAAAVIGSASAYVCGCAIAGLSMKGDGGATAKCCREGGTKVESKLSAWCTNKSGVGISGLTLAAIPCTAHKHNSHQCGHYHHMKYYYICRSITMYVGVLPYHVRGYVTMHVGVLSCMWDITMHLGVLPCIWEYYLTMYVGVSSCMWVC